MWSYGGVVIYVDKDSGRIPNTRVDLINPVTTELVTYIHQHGRDSDTRKISAHCMGTYESLLALANGTANTLVSDIGNEGSWLILSMKTRRKQALNKDYVVVYVDIELAEV